MIKEIQRKRVMCLNIACLCFVVLMIVTIIPAKQVNAKVSGFWKYEYYKGGVSIFGYTGGESIITIPSKIEGEKVKGISDDAFKYNEYIETVILPDTIERIGKDSFYDCSNLKKVDGLEYANNIEVAAFQGCSNLDNVTVGAKIIGKAAFSNCSSLKNLTFTENVQKIKNSAFELCTSLQKIILPDSIVELGNTENFTYHSDDDDDYFNYYYNDDYYSCKIYHYGDYAAHHIDDDVDNDIYPGYGDGNGLPSKHYGCFRGCTSLAEIVLGKNLKFIGNSCFRGCTSLKNINIPNSVQYIAEYCFKGCVSLESISIPDGIKGISEEMFYNCCSLKNIQLPSGLLSIERGAFYRTGIENLVIPNKVLEIGDYAFADIYSLNITLPNSIYYITESAFSEFININCYPDSYALSYASDNNIPYTILPGKPCEQFSFNKATMYLDEGERSYISYTMNPSNSTDYIKWESSDDSIASVNRIGEALAKKKGSVTIFATTTSGKRATFTLVVKNRQINSIYINKFGKTLIIKTLPKASIKIQAKKEILGKKTITVKTNSKGEAKIIFKKKIGKTKITITISKPGYVTKTIIE